MQAHKSQIPKKKTHGKWRKQQERDRAADKPIRAKEYSTSVNDQQPQTSSLSISRNSIFQE